MAPDPHHCFACDRRLDDSPADDDQRIRHCADCRADLDSHIAALGDLETAPQPRFRGVIALGEPLPGWPTAITMTSLDLWDRFSQLNLVEIPGPNPPPRHRRAMSHGPLGDQPPHKWTITTDLEGCRHHASPGSGGTPGTDKLLAWESTVAPTLPDDARRLDVHAQAPGASTHTTVDLRAHPTTRRSAMVEPLELSADIDPNCPSCGPLPQPTNTPPPDQAPGLQLDWAMPAPPEPDPGPFFVQDPRPRCPTCRSNAHTVFSAKVPTRPTPDRVVALGAELGSLFGSELVLTALVAWPTWFDLTIVGHNNGAWTDLLRHPVRAHRWAAQDNLGNHYLGASTGGGGSLGLVHKDLSFIPALTPDAATLAITIPASIDGRAWQATVDLTPATPSPVGCIAPRSPTPFDQVAARLRTEPNREPEWGSVNSELHDRWSQGEQRWPDLTNAIHWLIDDTWWDHQPAAEALLRLRPAN